MGVDATLELSIAIPPEFIIYSLAMAAGETPDLDYTGEPNVYFADNYIVAGGQRQRASYFPLSIFGLSLHLDYDRPDHPSWHILGRSTPRNIAILRVVAGRWGGCLIAQDATGVEVLIAPMQALEATDDTDKRFADLEAIAYTTPTAKVTKADRAAAYKMR